MSLVDLSDVVDGFSTGTYSVERFGAGNYTDGLYTPSGSATLQVRAMVVPAGGAELQRLPEGDRLKEAYTVLSTAELKTNETVSQADRITLPRGVFEVSTVEDWRDAGGFFKYLVTRVDLGD